MYLVTHTINRLDYKICHKRAPLSFRIQLTDQTFVHEDPRNASTVLRMTIVIDALRYEFATSKWFNKIFACGPSIMYILILKFVQIP